MLANQPKNDTLYIKGFNIVVENRAFTYRQVAQNVGQKVCLMPAHYGYLQNNPKVGVFVGAFPESDTVYLINQKAQGGYFDKHIAMFGFLSEQQAVDTYQKCFEYGYIGLMSVVPCTIEQLKWWLANGDKSRPVTKERLPYAGLERLDSVLWGGEDKADLASHGGQVSKLLYQIRQSDNFNHALEPLSYHDLTQELGNQGFVYENYDALVIEYNKLERKAKQLLMAMQGAADIVKPVGVAVSKPLTKGGVANVVAWFEMDDGQAVGVFFHNPDKTPKKIDPTDEMISYKWVLNKKDITIVVAPENGKDLVVRTVVKRIMKLVDANHDRFLKANGAKAELNLREQELNTQVIDKQAELDALNKAIEALEAQKAEKENAIKENQVASQMENNQTNQEVNTPVTLIGKELENPTLPQERPSNWLTNLANARAVAKSLGIETKGKKLERLVKDIGTNDENEVKKELLAEFKALASRLVLPKGYVFDLSDAEKAIDNAGYLSLSAWIKKQGKIDTNSIRIELRTIPDSSQDVIFNSVHFYTDDKKTKTELDKLNYPRYDDIGTSKPTTPKTIVEKMEQFLINAVFPKIEYLKVMNSTNVDVSKLSEIGIAEITDIGNENLYFEKDGKYYISKVGNPQLYALGEWDFAKYPDGVVSQATEPKQPESEPPTVANGKIYDYLKEMGKPDGKVEFDDDYMVLLSIATRDINLPMEEFIDDEYDLEKISKRLTPHKEPLFREAMANFKAKVNAEKVAAQNPDRDLSDFALVTFSSWKKNGKHRIYLKLSEKDNAFNKMDYGANDLGYLEIIMKNGSEKINNFSTVSRYSELEDKIIGSAFVDALQEYLSLKDIDIAEFNVATLKVKIKSDADVLAAKQAEWEEEANAEAQEKQAKQDKIDLQQAIIKENIAKFGMDAVVNDLSDASLGNKAKVDAVLAGTFLMSDKDFNSFLSFQKSAKPIITNHPDRDYLQSIIDGKADPLTVDYDALITLAKKYDGHAEMNPLLDQALEVINQAEQAASKGI